ncbi:hypothetical protein [Nocardia cyriacigeorgica]|uniref:hypothetical protein n=1 Tax=Nocardia cyriacigeorgica TaxID=135487 RepID=UPI0018950547|nr:hypothetical protein [Nocardia cyriacigeorgica]MBF6416920.1 hypothetical protein [Nocardia cyriacigeorgica]
MTTPVSADLNQVIVAAVQARIEAEVAAALSGDEVIGKYVAAALNQPIEVGRNSWDRRQTTFLRNVIDEALRAATKNAVQQAIAEEREAIERAVRAELRDRVDALAVQLVGSAVESVENPYGIKVELQYPKRDS